MVNRANNLKIPASAYKTYGGLMPKATHQRRATCEEAGCGPHRNGWRVPLSAVTDQIRADLVLGGWRFTEVRLSATEGYLEFPAGQPCLRARDAQGRLNHWVALEREPLLVVRSGDFRGGRLLRRHTRPSDWVDDFATHQDKVNTARERG